MRNDILARLMTTALLLLSAGMAQASVVQTIGAGSAVTALDASADFESRLALSSNPYLEDGLSFSRTGLTLDNNSCGFAGCPYFSPWFSNNYMYGTGVGGYFEMETTGNNLFAGLEFVTASGFGDPYDVTWAAFLNGGEVAGGTVDSVLNGTILGFASVTGFDTLRFGSLRTGCSNCSGPAFDSVRAMYASPIPVPAAAWLFCTALVALFGFGKRRQKARPSI